MTDTRSPLLGDKINVAILTALDQPRISTADLARRIGMSTPAVKERV